MRHVVPVLSILEYAYSLDITVVKAKFGKRESHPMSSYSSVSHREQGLFIDAQLVRYDTITVQHH